MENCLLSLLSSSHYGDEKTKSQRGNGLSGIMWQTPNLLIPRQGLFCKQWQQYSAPPPHHGCFFSPGKLEISFFKYVLFLKNFLFKYS